MPVDNGTGFGKWRAHFITKTLSAYVTIISLNIFFTFFLGLLALFIYDKCKNKTLRVVFVILISLLGGFIHVDYGAFGILLIFVLAFILAFAVGFLKVAKEEKIKKEQEKTKKISFKNNEKD